MNVRRISVLACSIFFYFGMSATTAAQDWIYTFRPGDTLWDLCIKYSNAHGCWIELRKHNNIPDSKTILPGDKIRFPRVWLITVPVVGRAENVRGEVLYDERSSGTTVPLTAGQSLLLGSRIVSREGSAKIILGSNSTLLIRPHSELNLDSLSTGQGPGQSAEVSLDTGDVEVKVEPDTRTRFQIKTPSAIAAVRGTDYRVSSRSGSNRNTVGSGSDGAFTRSEVLAGAVQVDGVGAALVPAGFGVKARPGKALGKPRELLPPPAFLKKTIDVPLPALIQWRADPGAVSWQLELLAGGGGDVLGESFNVDQPEMVFSTLGEGCYRLRLRGIDAEGFNGLESQVPLCIIPRIPAPTDVSVAKTQGLKQPFSVAWSAATGASTYRLEIATDKSFSNITSNQLVVDSRAEITPPEGAERFGVRVVAIDEYGNESQPSPAVEYIEPEYITPAIVTAIFLLIVLL